MDRVELAVENARAAKRYMENAGSEMLPDDDLIIRAAWAYDMLCRSNMIRPPQDDLDRPHAIAMIAENFRDVPPDNESRAALFSRRLDP